VAPGESLPRSTSGSSHEDGIALRHVALVFVVATYLTTVLAGPMIALVVEAVRAGLARAFTSLLAPDATRALVMSLALGAIAVVVNGVLGVLGALVIVRHRFVGRRVLSALVDLPLAISPVMVGLAFILVFGRGGLAAPVLTFLDVRVLFAFPSLVIATLFVTLPYTVREIAYILEELGTSEEEAATTLGASPWQCFWRVTFPNIRGTLLYGIVMAFARALGEFGAVLVLGGSISSETQTATTFLHDALEERQTDAAYGMALVLSTASVALLLVLEQMRRRSSGREDRDHGDES